MNRCERSFFTVSGIFLIFLLVRIPIFLAQENSTDTVVDSDPQVTTDTVVDSDPQVTTTPEPTTTQTTTEEPTTTTEGTTTPPAPKGPTVNVLLVYEKGSYEDVIDFGLDYLRKNILNPDLGYEIGRTRRLMISNKEPTKIIQDLCREMDANVPDIVVDFTKYGIPSESVKVVTRALQIPTVSASYGQPGDVREWMNLNASEAKYLVQISPPSDITMQIVRSLSTHLDIANMAILYDEEQYEMFYNYRSLLKDTPTRHLIMKVGRSRKKIKNQLVQIVRAGYTTFFIAAEPETIAEILEVASVLGVEAKEIINDEATDEENMRRNAWIHTDLFDEAHSWYILTSGLSKPTIECSSCNANLSLIHLQPQLAKGGQLRSKDGINWADYKLTGDLDELYHIDILLNAVQAVGKMKASNIWPADKPQVTCGRYKYKSYPELNNLDFNSRFKEIGSKQQDQFAGSFHIFGNGENFLDIAVKMEHFKISAPNAKTLIGYWRPKAYNQHIFDFEKGKDLQFHKAHKVYRVVTVVQPPFIYREKNCKKKNRYDHCYFGYGIDILNELQKLMNFNYTIFETDRYGFMDEELPHDFNGMVKLLQDKEADIGVGAFSVYPERERVMDFTHRVFPPTGYQILMRKEKLKTSFFKFLTVLETDVWVCILGAYFFTSILMWIFDRWSPYSYQNNKDKYEDDEEKREFSLKECLWFCMTSLTPQGGGEAPKNLSGRLVAATWWLFGFIIIASYTANLAAFLTVSRLEAPIESLEDLSRQYKVQYAPIRNSSAWFYFDRMAHIEHRFYEAWKDLSLNDTMEEFERAGLAVWEYPVSDKYTKLWQAMQENKPPDNYSHAVFRARSIDNTHPGAHDMDEFAWIGEAFEIQYEELTNCMFRVVGKEFSMTPYAFGVQKGSPLKEELSKHIRWLEHLRLFESLKIKWWDKNPRRSKCTKYDDLADGISIHNIGGVFLVVLVGFISTVLSMLLEMWWYRRKNLAEELHSDIVSMNEDSLAPSREMSAAFAPMEKSDFNAEYNRPPSSTSIEW